MSTPRALAAVLAAAALAAPSAAAAQAPDMRAIVQHQLRSQDLRSPDARDAAARLRGVSRTPPAAPRMHDQPRVLAPLSERPAAVADGGDGTDWANIALGIAGVLLVAGGLTAVTTRRNRRRRALRV